MGNEPEFAHYPNMRDADAGLYCFLDNKRVCGPDCMAFSLLPPAGKDYKNVQWARCHLLVDAHRGSKHIAILAQSLVETSRAMKKEVQDRQRHHQQPVPPPIGTIPGGDS